MAYQLDWNSLKFGTSKFISEEINENLGFSERLIVFDWRGFRLRLKLNMWLPGFTEGSIKYPLCCRLGSSHGLAY